MNNEKWLAKRISDKQYAVLKAAKTGIAPDRIWACNQSTINSLVYKNRLHIDANSGTYYLSDDGEAVLNSYTEHVIEDLFVQNRTETRENRVQQILILQMQKGQKFRVAQRQKK